jgi:hypothetical protein
LAARNLLVDPLDMRGNEVANKLDVMFEDFATQPHFGLE